MGDRAGILTARQNGDTILCHNDSQTMSHQPATFRKPGVLILSAILAGAVVSFVPTPNDVDGGMAKLVLCIFVTVAFKATIEYFLGKRQRKTDAKRPEQ
jgi:hypothetical protein